jgi:outer membrane receptor protein involved in Fe transport
MSIFESNWTRFLGSLLLIALLGLPMPVITQTVTGSISGTVTDPSGGLIVKATVVLTSDQTSSTRTVETNEEGSFTFAAVQPGVYTIRIEKQGFQALVKQKNVLTANERLALGEVELTAGQVSETVTVTSQNAVVERETSDLTARLTADQLNLISTKGRDVTSLLRLLPGTSNIPDTEAVGNGFGTTLPNFSGGRARSTVATVDGLNASEPSGSNLLSMTTSLDAIGEVKVLRDNYSAEYGNNGGAMINIVTKGGGKEYAGTAYYFIRNEALNGANFFNNKAGSYGPKDAFVLSGRNQVGDPRLPRALYRFNQWGFNFGGPLPIPRFGEGGKSWIKDRAFFFFNLEKPHTITPTDPVFVTVPTALERIGNFSQSKNSSGATPIILDPLTGLQFPGNIIPANRINKSTQNLLNYYPLPNSPTATNPGQYVFQRGVEVPKHSYLFRLDVKPSEKDSVYAKAQWWTSDNEGTATSGWPNGANGVDRWGIRSHYLYTDDGKSANWVHIFNSSVVNEFNIGVRRDTEGFVPTEGFAEGLSRSALGYTAPQLFPSNNRLKLVPVATGWASVAGNPANINWLNRWGEVAADHIKPSFSDNLSFTHGDHSFKFGAYFERLLNREAPGGTWSGQLDFGTGTGNGFTTAAGNTNFAYANAILGNFNSYTEQSSRPFTNLELKQFQWYAQDQWKVTRKLTLNYGMRFGYTSGQYQLDDQGSNFDPSRYDPAKAPLLYAGYCKGSPNGIPAFGTACSAANSFAIDPRVIAGGAVPSNAQLLNKNLVRAIIPGTGDPLNGLALTTDPSTPRAYRRTAPIYYEPRLGFAWDIFGDGRTVLRGMGGIYHSPRVGGGTGGASSLGNNPPQQRTFQILNGNVDNLTNLIDSAALYPVTISALEVNSHIPTTYNFSLGVQRDIGLKTVIEVSYVGAFARHLGERRNINSVPDNAKFVDCSAAAQLGVPCHIENRDPLTANAAKNNDFLRPYRGYGDINEVMYSGTSNYNGLQVQLNRRYTRGLRFGVAYTYSKSFDYANDDSSDVAYPRPYKAFNYGPSDFDQTHILTVNYIYDVPKLGQRFSNPVTRAVFENWQISGTTSYATGRPKNITTTFTAGTVTIAAGQTCPPGSIITSTDAVKGTVCTMITDFTGGTVNARPNVICDPMKGVSGADSSGTPYVINVGCFTNPTSASNRFGNQPRNPFRIPATFNSDLAFFKNIKLGEKRQIQLRWEIYNLFNRANFDDIDATLTYGLVSINPNAAGTACTGTNGCSAIIRQNRNTAFGSATSFGTPTTARTPRVMQGSIRLNF